MNELKYLIKRHPQVRSRTFKNALRFYVDHFWLDVKYKVNTRKFHWQEFKTGHVHMPSSYHVFHQIFDELPQISPMKTLFVDVGSGRGAALIMANERGFKCVVGIERSAALYQVARKNLHKAKHTADIYLCDAREFYFDRLGWKGGDVVVYCYNSFNLNVIDALMHNMRSWWAYREPGNIYFVYCNAQFKVEVSQYMWFEKAIHNDYGYFQWGIDVYRNFRDPKWDLW